ncbi:RNA polymerase sigma factor [Chitinophaga sp. G-6-1-13]|uniref:RNA polymerase sigma factor n=1 Tax=Chitinophaga fulva TaxID=2728842 RepID=A0A848GQD1_9BACT|nr:RNA polymerase sigma factor [Chitinophaga fulva]NML38098.1 RNA polymerase sigma factor [Chitinophaga fulva]
MDSVITDQFLAVVEAHKGIIYKVANAWCRQAEDRKDLVQEIIIQLWKAFGHYDSGQARYSTWIYRIALNVAISFYRKETRRQAAADRLEATVLEMVDNGPATETDEQLQLLQRFIHDLRELDRALILLYLEEKSHPEIAEILGISVTNVATKIGRIKVLLRQQFSRIKT